MEHKEFKKQFDKSFSKMKPEEVVSELEKEGYVFEAIKSMKEDKAYIKNQIESSKPIDHTKLKAGKIVNPFL
jgi:hypothetical protein